MNHWFRFYDGVVGDPKVQRLAPELFRFWVNCLCLASGNEGILPSVSDISYSLHMPESETFDSVSSLLKIGLLDEVRKGIEPHNWRKRQFKSDSSTPRVKRFRKRQGNVSGNAPDTEQNRAEQKDTRGARFEEFWLVCPKKVGKGQAEKAWPKAIKLAPPEKLISAMRAYAGLVSGKDKTYTLHPATWLNSQRWHDEGIADAPPAPTEEQIAEAMDKADRLMKRGKYAPTYQ